MSTNDAFHPGPYIRFSKQYYENTVLGKTDILEELFKIIAFTVQKDHKNRPLVVDDKPCIGKAKRYVAYKTTRLIRKLNHTDDLCRIKRFTSKTQINNLMHHQPTKITCYGTLIAYVILMEIANARKMDMIQSLMASKKSIGIISWFEAVLECCYEAVRNAGRANHNEHPNANELIDFFLECADVINKAIGKIAGDVITPSTFSPIPAKDFPYIPVLQDC